MLRDCRDIYINAIQCELGTLGNTIALNMQYGTCEVDEQMKTAKIASAYIRILKCYGTPCYMYKLTFKDQGNVAQTVTITIGVAGSVGLQTFTLSMTGTGAECATLYAAYVNGLNTIYTAVTSTRELFIYSYCCPIDNTTTVTDAGAIILSSAVMAFDDDVLVDMLDDKNCLTTLEICDIVNHGLYILEMANDSTNVCATC